MYCSMQVCLRIATAIALLTVGCMTAAGQTVGWIEANTGSARPVGRLADLQDGGLLLALAVERGHGPGWTFRAVATHAEFQADERQRPSYADAPWLPFDLDSWTLGLQLVHRSAAAPVSVVPALGLSADYLRSTPVYDGSTLEGRRLREIYPAAEASLQFRWRPVHRFEALAEVRGHVLFTGTRDTEILFEAAGSAAGHEEGTRWLAYFPVAVGIRFAL
jgi:hypothetical protein